MKTKRSHRHDPCVSALLFVVAALVSGCTDKAEADYEKCVAAEDVETAVVACKAAIRKDPTSKSGIAAAKKLEGLQATIGDERADDLDRRKKRKLSQDGKPKAGYEEPAVAASAAAPAAPPAIATVSASAPTKAAAAPKPAPLAKPAATAKQVRIHCPAGNEAIGARFSCACLKDGANVGHVDSPRGRDCDDMAGAEGSTCIFICR